MKLRADLSLLLILLLLSSGRGRGEKNYFFMFPRINTIEVVEETNISRRSGGGGSSKRERNSLEVIDVGNWGLTLINRHLSFHANQLARDTSGNDVFLSSVITEPLGIVETEIKDNLLYIYPKTLGEATVTVSIYNQKGNAIKHSFPIVVRELLPMIVKEVSPQTINLGDSINYDLEVLVRNVPEANIKINNLMENNNLLEIYYNDHQFSLYGKKIGDTIVTATLTDKFNSYVDISFPVTVTKAVYNK